MKKSMNEMAYQRNCVALAADYMQQLKLVHLGPKAYQSRKNFVKLHAVLWEYQMDC